MARLAGFKAEVSSPAASHDPLTARHSVPTFLKASAGQLLLVPSHTSVWGQVEASS